MTLHFLARHLRLLNQIDLTLRVLLTSNKKPTLIRLSNKASAQYVMEQGFQRISQGPKYHLLWGKCLVEIKYNDRTTNWFKVGSEPVLVKKKDKIKPPD